MRGKKTTATLTAKTPLSLAPDRVLPRIPVVSDRATNAMPLPGESRVGTRLHVCVGYSCNNNCIFCMEDDREGRFQRLVNQTAGDVRRMLAGDPGVREVMFTSGEPTLHERLPDYIRMARDLGYEVVGLITNGRRLAYRPYLETLLEAGLNHVLVSIHGPDARTHDALVRTRGAFRQALRGLANLAVLKGRHPALKVHTHCVLNRRNFRKVGAYLDALRPFRLDQHVFSVMMPEGRGARLMDTLMPRYSEVAAEFERVLAMLPGDEVSRVFLLDIPYCTTTRLPDSVRGYVERYFHFEPDGTVRFDNVRSGLARDLVEDGLLQPSALQGDRTRYAKVSKAAHDETVRLKRPECKACGFERMCRGVFRLYLDRFGWDEFRPVTDGGSKGP